jgi:hypothetical protein
MNECIRHRKLIVEMALDASVDVAADADSHCPECAVETPRLIRVLLAGLRLRARTPDAREVEAGRRRFLERLERGGPAFTTLIALAGGFFLMGLAAASGSEGDPRRAAPLLTAGAGVATVALAALGADPASRLQVHPPRRGCASRFAPGRRDDRRQSGSTDAVPQVAGSEALSVPVVA